MLLLDGDFVPGPPNLHSQLRHSVLPAMRHEMMEGTMLVIPALDCLEPWSQGRDGLPTFPASPHGAVIHRMFLHSTNASEEVTGKIAAIEALASGDVVPFQLPYHMQTNYSRWLGASVPYNVQGRSEKVLNDCSLFMSGKFLHSTSHT